MPKPDLSGAYGVVSPVASKGVLEHPERAFRFLLYQRLLWAVRIGSIALLLVFLYMTHEIQL